MTFMKHTKLPAEHTEDEQQELERAAMLQSSFDADCPEMGEEQLSEFKSVQQFQAEMENGMREGNVKGWLSGAQVQKRIKDRTEDRLSGATLRMMDESIQNMRKGKTSEATSHFLSFYCDQANGCFQDTIAEKYYTNIFTSSHHKCSERKNLEKGSTVP